MPVPRVYVICPPDGGPLLYITPLKLYRVLSEQSKKLFTIRDDSGDYICCLYPPHTCPHIQRQWKRIVISDEDFNHANT